MRFEVVPDNNQGLLRLEVQVCQLSIQDVYKRQLMAVARELNVYGIREADVHLAAGLPLTWIRKQREDFRSYLLRNKEVNFRFNGNDYYIRFVGCSLFPQGYPAIINQLGNFKGTNLLADVYKRQFCLRPSIV